MANMIGYHSFSLLLLLAFGLFYSESFSTSSFHTVSNNKQQKHTYSSSSPTYAVGGAIGTTTALFAADDELSFDNTIELSIKLPTRDKKTAIRFLSNPAYIVRNTWDDKKCVQVSDKSFLLQMDSFAFPGEILTPEIEMEFVYDSSTETVKMTSAGNWCLRGTSGAIVKDSRFMDSFRISIQGELMLDDFLGSGSGSSGSSSSSSNSSSSSSSRGVRGMASSLLIARGRVTYKVAGKKPKIFKAAPSFVMDTTIKVIQDSLSSFVSTRFSVKLLQSFRKFVSSPASISSSNNGGDNVK